MVGLRYHWLHLETVCKWATKVILSLSDICCFIRVNLFSLSWVMYSFLGGWCREKLGFYMHKLGFSVSWDVRVISVQSTCSTLTLNIFTQLIPYGNKKINYRGGSRIPHRRGANYPGGGRQHKILPNFPKNCIKLRIFWVVGQSARGAPL